MITINFICTPSHPRNELSANRPSLDHFVWMRRSIDVRCNILDNLAGSSFVSVDLGRTQIYTGVKLKVTESQSGLLPASLVVLELSCMRRLTPELADTLAYMQQLLQEHLINRQAGLRELSITNSRRHYLELHIQTFLLSEPHLSMLEALFVSVKQALASTSLPRLQCLLNQVTNEETVEMESEQVPLQVGTVESLTLVGCLEGKYILQLTQLEFEAVDAAYLVVVATGKVVAVQSLKGAITSEEFHRVCKFALANTK